MISIAVIVPVLSIGVLAYLVFHAPEMNNDMVD
jgi:hypothetical protein